MLQRLLPLAFCTAFLIPSANGQMGYRFNEFTVELIGHSLGAGATYRRTLDITHMHEWHGMVSTGITSGLFSAYSGLGYRFGGDWFMEIEALAGWNEKFGRRLRKEDPLDIQSGFSVGAHLSLGNFTIRHYSARVVIGAHYFQNDYTQFILGMHVGRLF